MFDGIIRSMSRWAVSTSDQGAVYLGYRLGHIKNDGRILRALVYNKGAMVLHMLRRLVGDEVFFRALRRFYDSYRFQKAGTDELRSRLRGGVRPAAVAVLRRVDLRVGSACRHA